MVSCGLVHLDVTESDLLRLEGLIHLLFPLEFYFQVEAVVNHDTQIFVFLNKWVSSVDLGHWVGGPSVCSELHYPTFRLINVYAVQ